MKSDLSPSATSPQTAGQHLDWSLTALDLVRSVLKSAGYTDDSTALHNLSMAVASIKDARKAEATLSETRVHDVEVKADELGWHSFDCPSCGAHCAADKAAFGVSATRAKVDEDVTPHPLDALKATPSATPMPKLNDLARRSRPAVKAYLLKCEQALLKCNDGTFSPHYRKALEADADRTQRLLDEIDTLIGPDSGPHEPPIPPHHFPVA